MYNLYRRIACSFETGGVSFNYRRAFDLFTSEIDEGKSNLSFFAGNVWQIFPSIFLRGHSCRRPGFVASIHRPQEAIRSFPIRERESGLIFRTVRDLHYIPKPEAVDLEGPRDDSEVAEELARFLPFVAHGSATRDIVSIVPLIGKIKVFRTTTSSTWCREAFPTKLMSEINAVCKVNGISVVCVFNIDDLSNNVMTIR